MTYDPSDFDLPPVSRGTTDNVRLENILRCVMESVAFYVYEENKVNLIFQHVAHNLLNQMGIHITSEIRWRAPKVRCKVENLDLNLS